MNEKKKTPPKQHTDEDARRILRRLQGEDGYDIFTDRQASDDRERLRREKDESRH